MITETKQDQRPSEEGYAFAETNLPEVILSNTAEVQAAYLLRFLKRGQKLLDCGCGPGSITIGLARFVAPGKVTGIDIQPSQVETTRMLAKKEGILNVETKEADMYELPFDDETFDVVHSHAATMYLPDPQRALKEMHRVLKPGGLIGIRNLDWDRWDYGPHDPLMDEFHDGFFRKYFDQQGHVWDFPRRQEESLLKAGFENVQKRVQPDYLNKPGRGKWFRDVWLALLDEKGDAAKTSLEQGWVDRNKLEAFRTLWRDWVKRRPDTFDYWNWYSAVGWKPFEIDLRGEKINA